MENKAEIEINTLEMVHFTCSGCEVEKIADSFSYTHTGGQH
jgi:hypothetical protein